MDILVRLQTLLRNFTLQVVTRVLTHGVTQGVNFFVQRQLVDDGLAAQVIAFVPFVVAGVLVETAFSWLQKRWNLLQIAKAKTLPADATNREVRQSVIADLKEEAK